MGTSIAFASDDYMWYVEGTQDCATATAAPSTGPKYIAAGIIPEQGVELGAALYGGTYKDGAFVALNNNQDPTHANGPTSDSGVGRDGIALAGRTAYAELSKTVGGQDFSALGNLPNGTRLEITYGGKSVIAAKYDVGNGGTPVQGDARAIGLWWETARLLDFKDATGVVTVHAVDPSTPLTPIDQAPASVPAAPISAAATNGLSSGFIYILGDSITVRAADSYRSKLTGGFSTFINASVGRSWRGGGITTQSKTPEGSYKPAKDAVIDDTEQINKADGIVIALGTNNGIGSNPVDTIIDTINSMKKNPGVPIWWVNTAASSSEYAVTGPFNAELQNKQVSKGYTIVDWANAVTGVKDPSAVPAPDINGLLSADGVHPNPTGVSRLTDIVVEAIKKGSPADGSIGGCTGAAATLLEGSDNEQKVWNYLAGKGLKPHQIAAFMGNMMAEAHFEPRLTEYAFSDPPHLSDTVPADVNSKGQPGYGIIQWTAPSRKQGLRDFAAEQQKSTGDLGLQLDFMWKELNSRTFKDTLDFVMASTTVESATDYICRHFEVPSGIDAAVVKRIGFAKEFLTKYGSGA